MFETKKLKSEIAALKHQLAKAQYQAKFYKAEAIRDFNAYKSEIEQIKKDLETERIRLKAEFAEAVKELRPLLESLLGAVLDLAPEPGDALNGPMQAANIWIHKNPVE